MGKFVPDFSAPAPPQQGGQGGQGYGQYPPTYR